MIFPTWMNVLIVVLFFLGIISTIFFPHLAALFFAFPAGHAGALAFIRLMESRRKNVTS